MAARNVNYITGNRTYKRRMDQTKQLEIKYQMRPPACAYLRVVFFG